MVYGHQQALQELRELFANKSLFDFQKDGTGEYNYDPNFFARELPKAQLGDRCAQRSVSNLYFNLGEFDKIIEWWNFKKQTDLIPFR